MVTSFEHYNDVTEVSEASVRLFVFYLSQGLVRICEIIRIYHECEGRIENSVPRITVWHHEACRLMTNGDPVGLIFLSFPHTNNRLFFLLTTLFVKKKLPEVHEYTKIQLYTIT